ncbi:amidohydrolase family protein [Streptomyces lonarensis]|uniref:amidohydrolase family protein n=1 Tax=Streptomyces lonarensis TaxID=700599 RepID=UPI0028B0A752|nr:amidohydrolase family protein [Streptomyces lonarensis]
MAGTDAPLDDIGIGIHQNLRALVTYGFTPVDALRTATGNAAAALGARGSLGVVAPGARADLVVVEGDPLRRVADAARVEHVLVDGHIHHVPELLEPYARTAAPGGVRPEPAVRPTGFGRGPSCCRTGPAAAHHR